MNIDKLLTLISGNGKKTFSVKDIENLVSVKKSSLMQQLMRAEKSKKIFKVARGVYSICSATESINNYIQVEAYINKLMNFYQTPYYIGLLSAAKRLGCTHYRPGKIQIITPTQFRVNINTSLNLQFHTKKHFFESLISQYKSDYGYINFSSPVLTIYDLIKFEKSVGGMENIVLIIKEAMLENRIKISDIKKLIKFPIEMSIVQKMGYLFHRLNRYELAEPILELKDRFYYQVNLSLYETRYRNKEVQNNLKVWNVTENVDWSNIDDT